MVECLAALVLVLEVDLEAALAVLDFPVLEQIFLILEREEEEQHRKLYCTIVNTNKASSTAICKKKFT